MVLTLAFAQPNNGGANQLQLKLKLKLKQLVGAAIAQPISPACLCNPGRLSDVHLVLLDDHQQVRDKHRTYRNNNIITSFIAQANPFLQSPIACQLGAQNRIAQSCNASHSWGVLFLTANDAPFDFECDTRCESMVHFLTWQIASDVPFCLNTTVT